MKRLLCLLLLSLLLPGARAEGGDIRAAAFTIPSIWGSRRAELTLDDRWFMADESAYHHGLARISLAMAVSAFRGDARAPDAPIRAFLEQLGFAGASDPERGALSGVRTWDFPSEGGDTAATAIAWRYLTCFESPVPLIAVAVGGSGNEEWAGNLDFGPSGDHAGFARGADRLLARIAEFERENGLADEACVYWLAGFGRGGAVCGAAAARLGASRRVFCYTFASPLTTVDPDAGRCQYIFNLVSPADALSMMPPKQWGFRRFGRDVVFPSPALSGSRYPALLSAYQAVYGQFTLRGEPASAADLSPAASAAADQAEKEFRSRSQFSASCRELLVKAITGRRIGLVETMRGLGMMNRVAAAANNAARGSLPAMPDGLALGAFASPVLAALYLQHDPAVYAAWLLSITDPGVLTIQP